MNCETQPHGFATDSPPLGLASDRLETELADHKPLFTEAEAQTEALRCLYCVDAPCIKACPTSIDIPSFIRKITTGNIEGSAVTILNQNLLGLSCARACPVEVLCEQRCVFAHGDSTPNASTAPIAIGRLQRFATERGIALAADAIASRLRIASQGQSSLSARRVACVGSGPASLAFAGEMARAGHKAIVLERKALAGGLVTSAIAPYKLHAHHALEEVAFIMRLGVEIQHNVCVTPSEPECRDHASESATASTPREVSLASLVHSHDAVFLGIGLGDDSSLGVPGELGPNVVGATAWIARMKLEAKRGERSNLHQRHVVVIGGGNTALDVARECALLGAKSVTMVYRRGLNEMSGYAHELAHARTEGVRLELYAQPRAFTRNDQGDLTGICILQSGNADADASVTASERVIACDMAIVAIGQSKISAFAHALPGLDVDERGRVKCDPETGETGHPGVFAGGDCVNGGDEVVHAVAHGRNAARALLARWQRNGS